MAELIAYGNTATTFAAGEFTVSAGSVVTLIIKGNSDGPIPRGVIFEIARKTSGGHYVGMTQLTAENIVPYGVVQGGSAEVTYAVRRLATDNSAGMDYA